jgi:hypothetical protein
MTTSLKNMDPPEMGEFMGFFVSFVKSFINLAYFGIVI